MYISCLPFIHSSHRTLARHSLDTRGRPWPCRVPRRWNQAVCVAKGLGFPEVLTPSFAPRDGEWDDEADAQAEAELRAMLDGDDGEEARSADVDRSSRRPREG